MAKSNNEITRRKFINLGVQGYAGLHLASGISAASMFSLSGCSEASAKTIHGVCYHDCPDSCSWNVIVEDGKIQRFEASTTNPFTGGQLCSKMNTFPEDITFNPERILTPLKRVGKKGEGQFERISWEQGMKEVADQLKRNVKTYGAESTLPFGYMGTQGIIQKGAMSNRFFAKLGASQMAETICGAPAITGNMTVNGQVMGVLPEDIVYSKLILLWGTNTKHSNVHLWPFVIKARENGAKVVVIDPFKSATALEADEHIQLMPGTDVALALGMMHVIIRDGLTDEDYIENYTAGFDQLREHVLSSYDPASVSEICGISEESIVEIAREYASEKKSLIRILVGMEHNYNGGDAFRAVSMLPSITGAWRERGGGLMHLTYEMFGQALNWERLNLYTTLAERETRTINMVQLGSALNDRDLDPPVKTIFIYNANPVVTIPNQNLIRRGLERDDLLTVVTDHFMTDSAKYADYIFPATTQLEHWDVGDSWGHVYINLNEPAIEPLGESRPNTEFFRLLANEMEYTDDCFSESDMDLAQSLFNTNHPYMEGITFNYLREHGWARLKIPDPFLPHAEGNFGTASGKCEFYSHDLEAVGMALPAYKQVEYEDPEKYPLQLLTVKATRGFHNSSHGNVKHLRDKEGFPTLDMSREDAEQRGISDSDEVRAFNQNGEVILQARLRDRIRTGVTLMPHGYWPSLIKGGSSSNALTDGRLSDIGGGAALQDCRVEVELLHNSGNDGTG